MASINLQEWFDKQKKVKICPICREKFLPVNASQVYCSHRCQLEARRIRRANYNGVAISRDLSDNMKAIYAIVKDDPGYGIKVAKEEGWIK